jgi:predicted PurR-regulated permease PerM
MQRDVRRTAALGTVATSALVVSGVVAGVALCCFVLVKAYAVALVLFTAIIIGEAVRPLTDRLSKRLNRSLSIALTLAGLAALCSAAVVLPIRLLRPQFASSLHALSSYASEIAAVLQTWLGASVRDQFAKFLAGNAAPIGLGLVEAEKAIGSAISVLVLVFLIAAFWLSGSGLLRDSLLAVVPRRRRARTEDVLREMGSTLGAYAGGVVVNGAIVALGSTLVLSFLHAPYPIVLGLLQGALVAIPYLGTLVAVVTAGSVVLAEQGWKSAVEAIALLSLMEGFEGSFISPLIFKQKLNLSPLATVLATGVGGALFGVAGVVLAVPTAALFQTAIERALIPALRERDAD